MISKNYKFVTLAVIAFLFFNLSVTAQVGIGTNTPNANAMLDVVSTTKGFLPPRMSTAQKTALTLGTGDAGMTVYDTDLSEYNVWDGTVWVTMSGAASSSRSLGNMHLTAASSVGLSAGGTKLAGTTSMVNSTDFTNPTGRLIYQGANDKVFTINASISFSRTTNITTQESFTFYIVKGGAGAAVQGTTFAVSKPAVVGTDDITNVSITGTVTLENFTNIEIWGSNASGATIQITNYNIVLQEL